MEPWLTQSEVARELRVSTRTVRRLKLPHMRVGNQKRYWMSEVYAALNGIPKGRDNVVALRPPKRERAA